MPDRPGDNLSYLATDQKAAHLEYTQLKAENDRLRETLEDCHDAICELLGASSAWSEDWAALPGLTGNTAWDGLKQRVDAALARHAA